MRTRVIAFLLAISCSISIQAMAQTADEILAKHEKAMGGLDNWNKIKTMELTGSVLQQGSVADITLRVKAGKAMRATNLFNGYANTWVITPHPDDGKAHKDRTSKRVDGESEDNVTFYWPEVNMIRSLLLDYKTNGMTAVYIGRDTLNKIACHRLKLTRRNGASLTAYFDVDTYYLLRLETTLLIDDAETEIFVAYKDYRKFNDVVIPTSCTCPNTGVVAFKETIYKKITINPPLADSLFRPQAE